MEIKPEQRHVFACDKRANRHAQRANAMLTKGQMLIVIILIKKKTLSKMTVMRLKIFGTIMV